MLPTKWITVGDDDSARTYAIGELPVDDYEGNRFFAQALTPSWDGSMSEVWGSHMMPTFEAARSAIRDTWSV